MTIRKSKTASVRIREDNPDHHLYNNNGTWWVHYTVYPDATTAARRRRSLGTRDQGTARERRDALFAHLFLQETGVAA